MLVARSAVHSLRVSAPKCVSVGKTCALSTSALRPTSPLQLQATQPSPIATPVLLGGGLIGAYVDSTYSSGLLAMMMRPTSTTGGKWVKGGFQSKMDRKEAIQILGLREASVNRNRIKDAHRRMMIANHPDRGGSPYLASKINEAKDLLERTTSR
ncbi:mitochondrial import inner membrane translocase subunit TIM14 [Malassezia nana]|uniref:Mitochondrial import inner membrane translocase subunit TIM14 n=1 Tax=Malassezia nana TaxID=180528 RepID=A0AAF0EMX3_9BASI|nr:mitochondrial import inner membrane translocase subunit TIM14 [Malassezia nana]